MVATEAGGTHLLECFLFERIIPVLSRLLLVPVLLFYLQEACVSNCSGKWIKGNQRVMQMFMEVQTQRQQALAQEVG